jgi:cyanophycin synthetase
MPQLLDKSIEILNIKYIRGPNMWCWVEVLEALVDIGELEEYPSDKIPGFYDRLVQKLPSLIEHRCSYEERGGFLKRVEEGTWPVHIMEHLTLELQGLAGFAGGFGRARESSTSGIYKLIVATPHEDVTRQAIYYARDLLMALIQDRTYDLDANIEHLKEMMDDLCIGPSTGCIVQAAKEKFIPHVRLSKGNLVQLGYGAKQKRIWTAETDQTSAIAETISRDKDLTKSLLASVGVPTPSGQLVDSAAQAWEIAQDLGLPVVIKPQDGNHGRGVFTNLRSEEEIVAAFEVARHEGSAVLVEKFIEGDEHRLLVVGDQLIAAAKGEECKVSGDGQHTILELIQLQINSDPRRGPTEDFPLNPVRIDSIAELELKSQGFDASSIPKLDQEVLIQRNGNVAFDVTELVHPSVARKVVLAAKVVGLDIAGVDLVAKDIGLPMESQGAAIVEVNAGPGLLMHIKPAKGNPQPVGQAIVNHLFPMENNSRIPIIGVCGSNGATVVSEICEYFLKLNNYYVALSNQHGLSFNQRMVDNTHGTEWDSGRRTILNPLVEVAVIESSAKGILMQGLPYDLCSVGIVTDIDREAFFPEESIVEEKQLFSIYRTQIDVVLPDGVAIINADDTLAKDLIEISPAPVLAYSLDVDHSLIKRCADQGWRTITAMKDQLVLRMGYEKVYVFSVAESEFLTQNTTPEKLGWMMAAIGAAWATGISFETIQTGIQTFMPEEIIS